MLADPTLCPGAVLSAVSHRIAQALRERLLLGPGFRFKTRLQSLSACLRLQTGIEHDPDPKAMFFFAFFKFSLFVYREGLSITLVSLKLRDPPLCLLNVGIKGTARLQWCLFVLDSWPRTPLKTRLALKLIKIHLLPLPK